MGSRDDCGRSRLARSGLEGTWGNDPVDTLTDALYSVWELAPRPHQAEPTNLSPVFFSLSGCPVRGLTARVSGSSVREQLSELRNGPVHNTRRATPASARNPGSRRPLYVLTPLFHASLEELPCDWSEEQLHLLVELAVGPQHTAKPSLAEPNGSGKQQASPFLEVIMALFWPTSS